MAYGIFYKDGSTWKAIGPNKLFAKAGGVWQSIKAAYVKVSGSWRQFYQAFVLPEGLIIPYNGTTAPTGWSLFTDATGYTIIGAGSSFAPGDTGGGGSKTFTGSSAGGHAGTSGAASGGSSAGTQTGNTGGTKGAHSVTASATPSAPRNRMPFIKAGAGNSVFPADAIVLAEKTLTGLTNGPYSNNRPLSAGSDVGTSAGTTSVARTTSGSGAHIHGAGSLVQNGDGSINNIYPSKTADTGHSVTLSLTYAFAAVYLTLWTNASAEFEAETGMIGMYEGTTAPDGWTICDGSNGTPDLRNYFVLCGTTANHGSVTSGGNTVKATGTTSSAGSHTQTASNFIATSAATGYHPTSYGAHTHVFNHTLSWAPPYYALMFIQYTG